MYPIDKLPMTSNIYKPVLSINFTNEYKITVSFDNDALKLLTFGVDDREINKFNLNYKNILTNKIITNDDNPSEFRLFYIYDIKKLNKTKQIEIINFYLKLI
jgi:hypothetical protein